MQLRHACCGGPGPRSAGTRCRGGCGSLAVNVLGQRRMLQEPVIGAAHFLIFWSFVFFATSFWWNLARGLLPFLPVPYADDVPWMALPTELFGALALVALAVAAVRRYIFTPRGPGADAGRDDRPEPDRPAAGDVPGGDGARALGAEQPVAWSPWARRSAAPGRPRRRALLGHGLYLGMWWAHMATVLGFLAYLPYSKHVHLLALAVRRVLRVARAAARCRRRRRARRSCEEFTWRQLFNALACAECGRCDRVCPAHASGYRALAEDADPPRQGAGGRAVPGRAAARRRRRRRGGGAAAPSMDAAVGSDESGPARPARPAWTRCPVFNEHIPLIVEMRRHLVAQGEMEDRLQEALMNLARYGNSFGKSARARAEWTQGPRLHGQGRPQGAGRVPLVRRRLRLVRSARAGR